MTDQFIKDDGFLKKPNQSIADDLNGKEVQEFLNTLKKHQDRYRELKEEIKECENMINLTKKMIYNICDHIWNIDHTISDEHTMYVCNKCNSNR
jgi:uncharacterized UPF0160 family protein